MSLGGWLNIHEVFMTQSDIKTHMSKQIHRCGLVDCLIITLKSYFEPRNPSFVCHVPSNHTGLCSMTKVGTLSTVSQRTQTSFSSGDPCCP